MAKKGLSSVFLSIILTSFLAVSLFLVAVYVIIIPSFEKNLMEGKKDMLVELTNTAWSLMQENHQNYVDSLLTLEEAKQRAKHDIEKIRYGDEAKDYFWITDLEPKMIMHPYRTDLNGKSLKDYVDPKGKRLFVDAVSLVKRQEEGFYSYMWQWKDDSTKIVDKLSYVKGFAPWQWVIGTGIYTEDVKSEMKTMERKLLRITFIITGLIILILLYIIRQSYLIERKRSAAENDLRTSRQKYKTLVEASTEGTLMLIDQDIVFFNKKFASIVNAGFSEFEKLSFNDLFQVDWKDVVAKVSDSKTTFTIETALMWEEQVIKDVVISVSQVKLNEQDGYIVIVKDVSHQKKLEKAGESLSQDLQTSLMMMNQPIRHFIKPLIKCDLNTNVADAAALMSKKKQNIVFISDQDELIGVVNDSDIRQRVVAKNIDPSIPVSQVMTAPVKSIKDGVLLYEAMLIFNEENLSHLAVVDHQGSYVGTVSFEEILNLQRNSLSFMLKEIENTESADQMRRIYDRIPVLVDSLLNSGAKTQNITRIISSIADAISLRVIELSIEEFGAPPCKFAFIALGSEGRMEQTLATDQDNAIIIDNVDDLLKDQAMSYFMKLTKKINKDLDYIGYNYCQGNVMAKNPKYCVRLDEWKNYFTDWIVNSDPQSLIDASIFFDFKIVYGENALVKQLKDHIHLIAKNQPAFFYHFALSIINIKAPSNHNDFNVKEVLLPFTGFAKVYGLQNEIAETNSLNRLEQLRSLEVITKSLYDELVFSYDFLMLMRFRFQVKSILKHENPGNQISGDKLTDIEKATLKKIFSELSSIRSKLSFDFKGNA